ncbi:MAG TPA: DUF4160 domain-containing protein [Rhizomicrobium sp.]
MPTLARFAGFEIDMYFEDHNPPHVHVVGREFEMLVAIRDGAVLTGAVPPRVRRTAMRWIEDNRAMLLAKWDELQ